MKKREVWEGKSGSEIIICSNATFNYNSIGKIKLYVGLRSPTSEILFDDVLKELYTFLEKSGFKRVTEESENDSLE